MSEKGPQLSFEEFNENKDDPENREPQKKEEVEQPIEAGIPGDPFGRNDPRYKESDEYKDKRYG